MFARETKYVKTGEGDIIIFPDTIQHNSFSSRNPISAGFMSFGVNKLGNPVCKCYGRSDSLDLDADVEKDTHAAMRQILHYPDFEVKENLE
jgi:hypothetical protein